ncbi:PIG-L family deacetylase [Kribbella solani]|uniref:PIG-L family deacetylase n=1 Tax=Kribbella solani TaxID=236067 RepID=UPI0029BAE463|nr:PIG-L family deacetylase [Kribbella solani]MDX2971799.1 PIG-L family deacetylase [Kribbella solani]MDX3000487.1 PIG-L family deacetylase [Kribbella solani]
MPDPDHPGALEPDRDRRLPGPPGRLKYLDVTEQQTRTALVVHAHPDDEVFTTAAATALLKEQGWHVVLRVATAGMHGSADHLTASCALLGIDEWDWLGTQDQWIDDGGQSGPRTLAAAATDEAALDDVAQAVEQAALALNPQLILTVGRDGLTGHPDHIAISQGVQRALRHIDCRALGARVRAQDVRAGEALVQRLAPGERIGSGQVTGCPDGTLLNEMSGVSEQRRRQAMDEYYPGLGSKPLAELIGVHRASSDGLLLRAVFDAAGWQRDRFEELSASPARASHPNGPSAAPSSR